MDNKLELEIRKIVKEELEKYKNNDIIIPKESFTNIFTLPENLRNNPLMEGYFASYDMETVKKYLDKRYNGAADIIIFNNENGEKVFRVITADSEINIKIINRDMSMAGYFPSYTEHKDNGTVDIQYEPRHQNKVNDFVSKLDYLYHITPLNKVNKILKIGLCPKTNNKMFNYPERIYFFSFYPDKETCTLVGKQLDYYNKLHNREYALLRIDLSKVENNFYFDSNAEECVYTKENIHPDAITVINNFNI